MAVMPALMTQLEKVIARKLLRQCKDVWCSRCCPTHGTAAGSIIEAPSAIAAVQLGLLLQVVCTAGHADVQATPC